MLLQLTAIAIFIAIFVIAHLRKAPLGIIMFGAACGTGMWLASMPLANVVSGFPVSIMVLLVGVTYFFAIAKANGTIDRLLEYALVRIGNNTVMMPFLFFALTAVISAMGSPLGSLVMAPIAMPVAKRCRIDPMLMALAIGSGFSAGGFAPTSLFGIVTYGTAHEANIDLNPFTLFAVAASANVGLLLAAFLLFGGLGLIARRGAVATASAAPTPEVVPGAATVTPFNSNQIATIVCMISMLATVIVASVSGLNPDVGVLCFAFGAVLSLIDPAAGRKAVAGIDWSTVLLVGGIITFVGVLQKMGAVDLLGEAARNIGAPLLSALVICAIGGLVSAFVSTTAILAALVPLAVPLAASGEVTGWAIISSLAVCSSIVDVSPFSTVGATLVATSAEDDRPRLITLLTLWGMSMIAVGPILLVGILVLPGTL